MSSVEQKIKDLGLTLPETTKPLAAYIPAVQTANLVFTSGQLPMVDGKLTHTGKVGAEVSAEDAKALAEICALNALAAIKMVIGISFGHRELIAHIRQFINTRPSSHYIDCRGIGIVERTYIRTILNESRATIKYARVRKQAIAIHLGTINDIVNFLIE